MNHRIIPDRMEYLQLYNHSFQKFFNQNRFSGEPESLYDPVNYILDLGGKRIRPLLALLACHLYDDNYEKALDAAFCLEVFHNFTLVHDDIMDTADIRRNQPTVHRKYSINQAILSGDVMLIKAFEGILNYQPDSLSYQLLKVFTAMSGRLCEGQQLDMDFEKRQDVAIGEYIKMIEGKTAVLLAAALQMGAMIGGAKRADAEHLYQFGLNFGIAFQLQDDVLDTFGTSHQVGKKIGGDILQNKKTYLFLKALELGDEEQKVRLKQYYNNGFEGGLDEKVEQVTAIFEKLGVREYAAQVMEAYKDLALSHVYSCELTEAKKDVLARFVNDLLYRDF